MVRIEIEIDTANEAFDDDGTALRMIIRNAADRIRLQVLDGREIEENSVSIRDMNGNRVGSWTISQNRE